MLKIKKPKQFKIFYFPNQNDPYFRKVEIITADNEFEAEAIFRSLYQYQIKGNELFFRLGRGNKRVENISYNERSDIYD